MEKINFSSFEDCIKEFEGRTILLGICTMIKTEIEIPSLRVKIENFILTLNSGIKKITEIDLNYIANFYKAEDEIKLELDSIGYILIKEK